LSYQWYYSDDTEISGATASSYLVSEEDYGFGIYVCVRGSRTGYVEAGRCSSTSATVLGYALANTPTPTVSGTVATGKTVTAQTGVWDEGVSFTYQWFRNGSPILLATSETYDIPSSDSGSMLFVRVTGSKEGYAAVSKDSISHGPIAMAFTTSTTPVITGTPTAGQTLKVTTGAWSPRPSFKYQWNCDSNPISGATRSSLRLTTAQNDCAITVTVTATARNTATTPLTSAPVGNIRGAPTIREVPRVTSEADTSTPISGEIRVGSVLVANQGSWIGDPAPTINYSYWYRCAAQVREVTSSVPSFCFANQMYKLTALAFEVLFNFLFVSNLYSSEIFII
jgi:hypothetical protein